MAIYSSNKKYQTNFLLNFNSTNLVSNLVLTHPQEELYEQNSNELENPKSKVENLKKLSRFFYDNEGYRICDIIKYYVEEILRKYNVSIKRQDHYNLSENFTFNINSGDYICIVGYNNCKKSLVFDLIKLCRTLI